MEKKITAQQAFNMAMEFINSRPSQMDDLIPLIERRAQMGYLFLEVDELTKADRTELKEYGFHIKKRKNNRGYNIVWDPDDDIKQPYYCNGRLGIE